MVPAAIPMSVGTNGLHSKRTVVFRNDFTRSRALMIRPSNEDMKATSVLKSEYTEAGDAIRADIFQIISSGM